MDKAREFWIDCVNPPDKHSTAGNAYNIKAYDDLVHVIEYSAYEKLREGLISISKNSCCGQCQEAKLVALMTLAKADGTYTAPDMLK